VDISLKSGHKEYLVSREDIYDSLTEELSPVTLSGQIEMDETTFGGKRAGKRDWGAAGKQMVFGMYLRNGQVLTFPIRSRVRSELMQLVTSHTGAGSTFYTDDWHVYGSLPINGDHVVVTKE
jgi:transposase